MGRWARKAQRKRERMQTEAVPDYVKKRCTQMYRAGEGRSRRDDKRAGDTATRIYSVNTMRTYIQQGLLYARWLSTEHPRCSVEEARACIDAYLHALVLKGRSAYTISTAKAALSKIFDVPYADLMRTPSRERAQIIRSRAKVAYDAHISAQQEEYWGGIVSAVGFRRSELLRSRGSDLGSKTMPNGTVTYYVRITGKGGKTREAVIYGPHSEEIVLAYRHAGTERVWRGVPQALDVHHYRAEYAKALYKRFARPLKDIPLRERYVCRKDKRGIVYDRKAMLLVSRMLGHNRIDVIAEHYLY